MSVEVIYVEFFSPGSFFAESSLVKFIGDPIPVPPHAFGWCIKARREMVVDGEKLAGLYHARGKKTLIGNFHTVDELKARFGDSPDHRILISNIEGNDYRGACLCRTGNWQPVDDGVDIVPSAEFVTP
jgi:hypothetical protein